MTSPVTSRIVVAVILLAVVIAYHACFGVVLTILGMTASPHQVLTKLYPHVVHGIDAAVE